MAPKKTVTVILEDPKAKKSVVRYDAAEDAENPAVANAYIDKAALATLGNPDRVKITIEAA